MKSNREGGDELKDNILYVEEIRKTLGMTQEEMAKALGMTRRGLIDKIQGKYAWTVPEMIAISRLYRKRIAVQDGDSSYSIKIDKI